LLPELPAAVHPPPTHCPTQLPPQARPPNCQERDRDRPADPLSSPGGRPHPARARRLRLCRALRGRRVQNQTRTPQMVSDPRSSAGHGGRNTTALPPTKSSLLNPTANPLAPFMTRLLARTYSLQRAGTRLVRRSTMGPSSSSDGDHLHAQAGALAFCEPQQLAVG